MSTQAKTHQVTRSDGTKVPVSVPQDPTSEEILADALRENLSPEAIAVIVAYLQPAKSKDAAADQQVRWFSARLVEILGGNQAASRLLNEVGV